VSDRFREVWISCILRTPRSAPASIADKREQTVRGAIRSIALVRLERSIRRSSSRLCAHFGWCLRCRSVIRVASESPNRQAKRVSSGDSASSPFSNGVCIASRVNSFLFFSFFLSFLSFPHTPLAVPFLRFSLSLFLSFFPFSRFARARALDFSFSPVFSGEKRSCVTVVDHNRVPIEKAPYTHNGPSPPSRNSPLARDDHPRRYTHVTSYYYYYPLFRCPGIFCKEPLFFSFLFFCLFVCLFVCLLFLMHLHAHARSAVACRVSGICGCHELRASFCILQRRRRHGVQLRQPGGFRQRFRVDIQAI